MHGRNSLLIVAVAAAALALAACGDSNPASPSGTGSVTVKGVLLASYRSRKPVVSYSPAHVRSGAVASIYSSPVDIGRHLAMLINEALKKKPDTGTPFQFARFYSITTNSRIATALGINLPAERDLRSTLDKLGP